MSIVITMLATAIILGPKQIENNLALLLSSMLSSGLCGMLKRRQIIFIVWLLLIRILVDIYSSCVSSRLISPSAEKVMKTVGDLDKNNYSAAVNVGGPVLFKFFSLLASNKSGTWVNQDFVHLKNLFARSVVASNDRHNRFEIAQFLVTNHSSKVAYCNHWYYGMYLLNMIEDHRDKGTKTFENGARCYLGNELLHAGGVFWMFLPPNNKLIARYFQQLLESGIFDEIQKESLALLYSVRIQERNRFVSKTNIRTSRYADRMNQELKQQLQGKLSKVFLLWALCILTCVIGLGVELTKASKKSTKVVKFGQASKKVVKLEVVLKWYRHT